MIDTDDIESFIVDLIRENFEILLEGKKDLFNVPLTSKEIGLDGIELIYIYMEVEKKYKIRIDPDDIDNYGFSTIDKIVRVTQKTMRDKLAFQERSDTDGYST